MNHFSPNRIFPATLLLSSALATVSCAQTPTPNAATPLLSLDFETPSGTSVGNVTTTPGLAGRALTLNGTGALELAQSLDTSRSYSVMAWVKVTKSGGFQTFLSSDGPKNSAFFLQLRDDTKNFAFTMLPSGDGDGAQAKAQDEFQLGDWNHIAGVFDAQKQTVSLYVNGVLQESVPFNGAYRAPGPIRVGRAKYDGNAVDFAAAQIDNAQVFQSALTAPQIAALVLPLASNIRAAAPITPAFLSIDASKVRNRVSPTLYGLMTEEINHSYDGGLYGELLQNRAFQDDANAATHWSLVQSGGAGTMSLDRTLPLNSASPVSLKLQITDAKNGRVGVQNDGYWGVPIKPRTRYSASFWARASDNSKRPVTLSLEGADGKIAASGKVTISGTAWKQYRVEISTGAVAPTTGGRFVLATREVGSLWLSQFSLFPPTYKNRANGNRIDLMEKMAAMKPTYLRFPGGNYLEGNTIAERFDWKKTLGPVETRPGHQGPWGYRSTDGMGLLEFLHWCDDLNMEPVLGVFAGYALRGEYIKPGPLLQPYVQDALDEIEYLIGDKNTVWGARRIADGHPNPFKLTYVEIGNEDFFDRSGSYDGRFAQFYDAIKAKYPQLQLISTTMDPPLRVTSRKPDLIDEHYYLNAREMERRATFYDNYDRSGPKIFVGEWASHTERIPWQDPQQLNAPTPDMGAALGDAAFMTGMERNSDIVVMQCYAPLLVNVNPGARQWAPNLIGYDNLNSYGAPSFYAQAMFAKSVGDVVLDAQIRGGSRLNSSVTRNTKTGQIFVKVVNSSGTAQNISFALGGAKSLSPEGTLTVLRANSPKDTNSLAAPTKIVPQTRKMTGLKPNFAYAAPAYSVSVLEMTAK